MRAELLAGGSYRRVGAHRLLSRVGTRLPDALILSGLVRTYVAALDGRDITLSYARAGRWIGLPVLPEGPFPCIKETVSDTELIDIRSDVVAHLARTQPSFGWAVARAATIVLYSAFEQVSHHILASLAGRVAYQILQSAEPRGGALLSPMRQRDLAQAVGSPRESVARALARLRKDGLVALLASGILVRDAEGLRERSRTAASAEASTVRAHRAHPKPPRPAPDYQQALTEAIEMSVFGRLSEPLRGRLLAEGLRLDIPAHSVLYRAGESPRNGLLVSGLVRSFTRARDGRQFTLVYSRPGNWLGLPTVTHGPFPLDVETLTDVTALEFPGELIERSALADATLAWAIAEEITRRVYHGFDLVTAHVFAPISDRVAHRILQLSQRRPPRGELIAPLGVAALADSVGATRTSVSRVLRQLREAGAIQQDRRGIRIIKPEALAPHTWVDGSADAGAGSA